MNDRRDVFMASDSNATRQPDVTALSLSSRRGRAASFGIQNVRRATGPRDSGLVTRRPALVLLITLVVAAASLDNLIGAPAQPAPRMSRCG
jgi:hypothetical protein